jgi:Wiskott-Aldrich syndrome protein
MSIASRLSANRNAPREPESPLQFTQNPSRFAPPLESTQPFLNRHTFGSFARSPVSQPHSQTTQQRASLASKSDLNSQSRLERASSGLVGMAYSSQFNVNEHVHRVTDFIEKDVDFTAWVHDNDDEDIVEVGTSQTRPMADSQS